MPDELNKRQKKFCGLCAEGIAPSEAAALAGYRKKGIEKTLLASEKIRTEITERRKADGSGESAGKEEILVFLTELMRDEKETDIKTRMRAAEILGKRAGAFEKDDAGPEQKRVVIVDDIP